MDTSTRETGTKAELASQPDPRRLMLALTELCQGMDTAEGMAQCLSSFVDRVGCEFEADRCIALFFDKEFNSFDINAEYVREPFAVIGSRHYQLGVRSELLRLLTQGKPVPLKDVLPADPSAATLELTRFLNDSGSKSVIAFPMLEKDGGLTGCLTLHYCTEARNLPEDWLNLGESVTVVASALLAMLKDRTRINLEHSAFDSLTVPAIILRQASSRVERVNSAFSREFEIAVGETAGRSLSQVMQEARLMELVQKLGSSTPWALAKGVQLNQSERPLVYDVAATLFDEDPEKYCLLTFYPVDKGEGQVTIRSEKERAELVETLSRQVSWERWVRQIVSRMHNSLDRDTLLQSVADGLGRALGCSRCLIVRIDGLVSPMVTHEYVEPDSSPLGLGRTGAFPAAVLSTFRNRTGSISDVTAPGAVSGLTSSDLEYLSETGIRGVAGSPISRHGVNFGIIVLIQSGPPRPWQGYELEMLEVCAMQSAVALGHSQSLMQMKDQLFNMNLLGNLAQQLTNTLELASRGAKEEIRDEKSRQMGSSPPLSLRELEVLKLIASGLANREIAQRLFLTESTVELHASRIRKKLKLKSRTALVKYACDNNLV